MPLKIRHRVRTRLIDNKGRIMQDQEESSTYVTYGAYLRVPVPKKVGVPATYTVTVEYLGEHQYKRSYEQRVKAHAKSQERIKKWKEEQAKKEIERQEQQLIQRRTRIMNQIELAFVKNGKDAVNFVTCDKCEATAKFLGLAYENPGGDVIDPDQITGAWCQEHDNKHQRPFKTTAAIACERLEFFYDGLRQLYVKSSADHTAVQVGSRGC